MQYSAAVTAPDKGSKVEQNYFPVGHLCLHLTYLQESIGH